MHTTALNRRFHAPNLASQDATAYLDHLISLPLASLNKEPTLISAEASTVESELTNLCYREYPTFLSVHRCSAAVRSAFDDFQGSLDQLLDSVPTLEDECRTFSRRTQGLSAHRNRSILVQDQQDKLLDLLELPQLMETCVRNGYYQEAMELSAHARGLRARYPGTRLVDDVAREVEGVEQLMLAQLFSLLREPVKLPTAMKTISYLRRMDLMEESSIGLAFLSGRLHNFRVQLLQIEKDRTDPVRYLRRYIDFFREHVYDISSQFTAMFDDFDSLISFTGQCVTDLVSLVESLVPQFSTDSAALSSILVQLGYCSLSFSRLGLDFAPLIAAPFAETVLATYAHAIAAASQKLSHTLRSATQGQGIPTDSLIDNDKRALLLASPPSFEARGDAPPPAISNFPPLATFLNETLSALNSLRLLAPVPLVFQIAELSADSISTVTEVVLEFVREAVMLHEVPNGVGTRPKHARTPSSPRAQLLRRNTETQLAPNVRAAKRRETQQICVSLAEGWMATVRYLQWALRDGVYDGMMEHPHEVLNRQVDQLSAWIALNRLSEASDDIGRTADSPPDSARNLTRTKSTLSMQPRALQMVPDAVHDVFGPPTSLAFSRPASPLLPGGKSVFMNGSEVTAVGVASSDDGLSSAHPALGQDVMFPKSAGHHLSEASDRPGGEAFSLQEGGHANLAESGTVEAHSPLRPSVQTTSDAPGVNTSDDQTKLLDGSTPPVAAEVSLSASPRTDIAEVDIPVDAGFNTHFQGSDHHLKPTTSSDQLDASTSVGVRNVPPSPLTIVTTFADPESSDEIVPVQGGKELEHSPVVTKPVASIVDPITFENSPLSIAGAGPGNTVATLGSPEGMFNEEATNTVQPESKESHLGAFSSGLDDDQAQHLNEAEVEVNSLVPSPAPSNPPTPDDTEEGTEVADTAQREGQQSASAASTGGAAKKKKKKKKK